MMQGHINRRTLVKSAAVGLAVQVSASAQQGVFGKILFIKNGNIMQWTPDGVTMLREDGSAMAPTWQPDSNLLMYVRSGGSYSNLITLDTDTGRTRRLTNSESSLQKGSQEYVQDSDWIVDPFWSESGIVVFGSTAENPNLQIELWMLRYDSDSVFPGPTDYAEPGQLEKTTADAAGKYACYTVTSYDPMSSYIGMRDLDTGQTWPVMQGAQGAFDGAISPNGRWVIGTIRDSDDLSDLWLCNWQTEESYRLTNGEQASSVTWDFLGDWVVYLAFVGDGFSMRAFRIDFTGDQPTIDGDIHVLIENDQIDSTSRLSWTR